MDAHDVLGYYHLQFDIDHWRSGFAVTTNIVVLYRWPNGIQVGGNGVRLVLLLISDLFYAVRRLFAGTQDLLYKNHCCAYRHAMASLPR